MRTPFLNASSRQILVPVTHRDDLRARMLQVSETLEIRDASAPEHPDADLFHVLALLGFPQSCEYAVVLESGRVSDSFLSRGDVAKQAPHDLPGPGLG